MIQDQAKLLCLIHQEPLKTNYFQKVFILTNYENKTPLIL